jgi:ATP-dependent DNA helicase HFM1/MER3
MKPTLVFCATRKEVSKCATLILETVKASNPHMFVRNSEQREKLIEAAKQLQNVDRKLAECVAYGLGFHNGGLDWKTRQIVERLFRESSIFVLCTTSTLAQGVNLPAHLVIIKGVDQVSV